MDGVTGFATAASQSNQTNKRGIGCGEIFPNLPGLSCEIGKFLKAFSWP
jgi:hypothetical protein